MTARAVENIPVVIIGGGQAGLAVSWHLTRDGIEHVVLERSTVMHNWRDARWDSFCLVTPNWQCQLPGYGYTGSDPDGFMIAAELNDWLAGYVRSFSPPVREHTTVRSVIPMEAGFEVSTDQGVISAGQVVVATGGYHNAAVPRLAERLPADVVQLHSSSYRSHRQLPDKPVLVVGTGQSGAQIAEDLHLAGRAVHLAVGTAPRVARRYRGRDVVAWLADMGHYDRPVTDRPLAERYVDKTNHYLTGRDGGRDIDLRRFAQQGMALHGRLVDVTTDSLQFAADLEKNLDAADAVYNGINAAIDSWIDTQGVIVAEPPSVYTPTWRPSPGESAIPAQDLGSVVWATGFTNDYRWLNAPVFDGAGHPQHLRGVTGVPGLYFIGLPWLHSWGSGRFAGIARDADHLATHLRALATAPATLVAAGAG
jgi:putative flavoprotein involved in K+ transport